MKSLAVAIAAVIDGDLAGLSAILAADHYDLQNAAVHLREHKVSRSSLTRVLQEWCGGRLADEDVQHWASFIRCGYVSGNADPVLPLDIDYDESDEDLIVEIIGRFNEIGDSIDGEISENEKNEMLDLLRA